MLLLLCRCHLRHINHVSINIATHILGGRRWHDIWRIWWSPTRYWRSLQLMHCVMWKSGWLLTTQGKLSWIKNWIIQWIRQRYYRWWQIIALWVTVFAIKAPVTTGSVLWKSTWLLTKWGQLRWIDDWIIQRRKNVYHRRWQLVALWVNVLEIKTPFITRSRSLPTLIVPCSAFLVTTNDN